MFEFRHSEFVIDSNLRVFCLIRHFLLFSLGLLPFSPGSHLLTCRSYRRDTDRHIRPAVESAAPRGNRAGDRRPRGRRQSSCRAAASPGSVRASLSCRSACVAFRRPIAPAAFFIASQRLTNRSASARWSPSLSNKLRLIAGRFLEAGPFSFSRARSVALRAYSRFGSSPAELLFARLPLERAVLVRRVRRP